NNGFGNDNTVSVIDINSYELIDTITVGAAPTEMIVDGENRIWVSCNGKASFDGTSVEEPGSLYIIDGNSGQVITSITEGIAADGAGYTYRLALDEEHAEAYLINNGVSVIDMNSYEIKEQIIDSGDYSAIGFFLLRIVCIWEIKEGRMAMDKTEWVLSTNRTERP